MTKKIAYPFFSLKYFIKSKNKHRSNLEVAMNSKSVFLHCLFLLFSFFILSSCENKGGNPGSNTFRDTTVTASLSTSNPFLVQVNTSGNVTVTFNATNSQNPAYDLVINSFTLPAGWTWVTPAPAFDDKSNPWCLTVGVGNCSLTLRFSPVPTTNPDSGTVVIPFTYLTTDKVTRKSNVATISYKITTNNTLNAATNPSTILATIGTTLPVDVTFSSSDINPVTNVAISFTLPTGWTDVTTLPMCTQITSPISTTTPSVPSATCTNTKKLRYSPTGIAVNSSFPINYTYIASNGVTKSGSLTVNYRSTANNTFNVSLSETNISSILSNDYEVWAYFYSSDSNTISNFNIAFDGTAGSNGWSIGYNSCTTANITYCQMQLLFHPTTLTNYQTNSIAMAYTYRSNSGFPQGSAFGINYVVSPNSILFFDPHGNQISSLEFTTPGTQTVYLSTNDVQQAFNLITSISSNPPLSILSSNCENNSVQPYGHYYDCEVNVYYDGSSNGTGALIANYNSYPGSTPGESSLDIKYNDQDSLFYKYVDGSLDNIPYGRTGYLVYYVYLPYHNIYESFINADNTSYPSNISRVDSSIYGYQPSCDNQAHYWGYCYVAFEYTPISPASVSGTFDFNAQYGTYDTQYWVFWWYRYLSIPHISYSTSSPYVTYDSWPNNSLFATPPDINVVMGNSDEFIFTIHAPYGDSIYIDSSNFHFLSSFNPYNSTYCNPNPTPYLGLSSYSGDACDNWGNSCSVSLKYDSTSGYCGTIGWFNFTYDYWTNFSGSGTLSVSSNSVDAN